MGDSGEARHTVRPYVLHKKDIDAMPLENFSNDDERATGGWKSFFSAPYSPTDSITMGIAHFPPASHEGSKGSMEAQHRHMQAEWYYMLSGRMIATLDGVEYDCLPGTAIFIPGDGEHGFYNPSTTEELVFLWGFSCDSFKDVVYRFTGDIEKDTWKQLSK